jgi:hypothetical protein
MRGLADELARTRTGGGVDLEAELGGDNDLVAYWRQRFANQFPVTERTIYFGGVEKRV